MVKEEIADESTILPCFNGRVVSWVGFFLFFGYFLNDNFNVIYPQLVTADGSNQSDNCSEIPHSEIDSRIGE